MHVQVINSEVIFGDGLNVYDSISLPAAVLERFLGRLFKHLFDVDANRNCHRCEDACEYALTLHFGRPFHSNFLKCVPE